MSRVRVAFLGTPQFAVTSLKGLLSDPHFEVVGVVTQPDRPAGRSLKLTASPVKQLAEQNGLKCLSPSKINQELILQEIDSWKADVAVVVAFGQILSQKFLDLFPHGAVNVHASLLPKWRGAAPIQRAVQAGDTETGVCLQRIVKELDAGDVFGWRKIKIEDNMSALALHDHLAVLGVELLHVELMDYIRGNLAPTAQDHTLVTYAKKIDKAECEIDWQRSAQQIHNQVRGFQMGPGTYSHLLGKRVKIHQTLVKDMQSQPGPAGKILHLSESSLDVACGSGVLQILNLQLEGKTRMAPGLFIKSLPISEGDSFTGEKLP